ncbi:MAG: DUF4905 domain-containing protein [Bacteroidota bacterium]
MIHSSQSFDAPIWKVMPDHANSGLAIELRDKKNHSLQIAYIDLAEGQSPIFIKAELDWWQGLQTVFQGRILLHGYEDPGLPLQRGLSIYNGKEGTKLWENSSLKFTNYLKAGIMAEVHNELKLYSWDSGEEVVQSDLQEELHKMNEKQAANLGFPQAYIDAHDSFENLAQIVQEKSEKAPEIQIDFARFGSYQIYNFYHRNTDESWSQFLGIRKGKEWPFYRQTADALKGLGLDPFFLFKNYLIWLEQENTLSYLSLDESNGST